MDQQKCKDTEFRYGMITGKYVIYKGETRLPQDAAGGVTYLNVEEYLKSF